MFSYTSYRSDNNSSYIRLETEGPHRSQPPVRRSREFKHYSEPPKRRLPEKLQSAVNEKADEGLEAQLLSDEDNFEPAEVSFHQSTFHKAVDAALVKKQNSVQFTRATWLLKRVDSIYFQLFMLAIIITDLVLSFYKGRFRNITLCILGLYLLEIILRGIHIHWWYNFLNVLDVMIVLGSIVFQILSIVDNIQIDRDDKLDAVANYLGFLRSVYKLLLSSKRLPKAFRGMVRNNKQGFHNEEWDLDLCYISDRIISMGLPSTGIESLYRNPIDEVRRFLDHHHFGKYVVFDLCEERSYDARHFHGRVSEYKFPDHSIPSLGTLFRFCREASEWLEQDPENVVCVHCRGGKGRTGTVVTCLLRQLYRNTDISQLHDHFARMRTNEFLGNKYQGVRNPSQLRYTQYFEKLISDPDAYTKVVEPIAMVIGWIKFGPVVNARKSQWGIQLCNLSDAEDAAQPTINDYGVSTRIKELEEENMFEVCIIGTDNDIYAGNVGIEFFKKSKNRSKTVGVLWIHSLLCKNDLNADTGTIKYDLEDIDKMHKKKNKYEGFQVEIRVNYQYSSTPLRSSVVSLTSNSSRNQELHVISSFNDPGFEILLSDASPMTNCSSPTESITGSFNPSSPDAIT